MLSSLQAFFKHKYLPGRHCCWPGQTSGTGAGNRADYCCLHGAPPLSDPSPPANSHITL